MKSNKKFDELMTQQQNIQNLSDPSNQLKKLDLLEKAHLVSLKQTLVFLVFASVLFGVSAYVFLSTQQPTIKNQIALFISICMFLFQLRFFLKGYSLLKDVRNLKKEIKNTL